MIDQNQYLENLEVDNINPARVGHKNDDLDEKKKTKIRKMAGSLNWIVRGTRPNKSFELIDASTKFQTGKIEDLVRLRKTLVSIHIVLLMNTPTNMCSVLRLAVK